MAKLLEHPLTIILITIVSALLIISLRRTAKKSDQSTAEIAQLEEKAYNLSQEVKDLQDELEHSKSPTYKEKILRDQLLLQKDGEYVVQLSVPEIEHNDAEITPQKTKTNQEKWFDLLF